MSNILNYHMPDCRDHQTIISLLSQKFRFKKHPLIQSSPTFFDSFDWRLFNNGLMLTRERNDYVLTSLTTEALAGRSIIASNQPVRFWWDFPAGTLQEQLRQYLDVRALLPLVKIKRQRTELHIINDDEKTVVRIHFDAWKLLHKKKRREIIHSLTMLPVKGYEAEFLTVKNWLNENGIEQEIKPIFLSALEAMGKSPGDYSSKLNFTLQPGMTARAALQVILKFLFNIISANVGGIKADVDTEFLHDFRVAIRRTRSALSQVKGVVPKEICDAFRSDFAVLQKASNHLRDLDVYLLNRENYRRMLPLEFQSGLDPLFKKVQEERSREHQHFIQAISADSFRKLMESWRAFLDAASEPAATKNSPKPILKLAAKFIFKAYHRTIASGKNITDNSPTSDLHLLRIECKKLRYLLEFFASLFPAEEMSQLIDQLKKLQDNLGRYNDLSVQQKSLKRYLAAIASEHEEAATICLAIGGLITSLYHEQQKIRLAFADIFAEFSGPENEQIYQKLFA